MTNAKQIESNVIESFQLAKKDISLLSEQLIQLKEEVARLKISRYEVSRKLDLITSKRKVSKKRTTKKTVSVSKKFVASKLGKKVHNPNCFFATNIDKKNRLIFNTKTKALNEGFKLCSCLAY